MKYFVKIIMREGQNEEIPKLSQAHPFNELTVS